MNSIDFILRWMPLSDYRRRAIQESTSRRSCAISWLTTPTISGRTGRTCRKSAGGAGTQIPEAARRTSWVRAPASLVQRHVQFDEMGDGSRAHFLHDFGSMNLDRAFAQPQVDRDDFVGAPIDDEIHD